MLEAKMIPQQGGKGRPCGFIDVAKGEHSWVVGI
jgi:hypothetical protein